MSDDSEAFASADEGIVYTQPAINTCAQISHNTDAEIRKIEKEVKREDTDEVKDDLKVTKEVVKKRRKVKKMSDSQKTDKKVKLKKRLPETAIELTSEKEKNDTPSHDYVDSTKDSCSNKANCALEDGSVSVKDNYTERNCIYQDDILLTTILQKSPPKYDVIYPEKDNSNSFVEQELNVGQTEVPKEDEFISTAATTITRGLEGGFNKLASAFSDMINLNSKIDNKSDENVVQQQSERQMNESVEQRNMFSDAWNSVWNSTNWENNDNDGWETENIFDDELKQEEKDMGLMQSSNNDCNTTTDLTSSGKDALKTKAVIGDEQSEFKSVRGAGGGLSFWSDVSRFTENLNSRLQTASSNLIHGGVDVLEMIGRTTMSVLAENDPGYKYTKKILRPTNLDNRPNLSQILREAAEVHSTSKQHQHDQPTDPNRKLGDFAYQLEQKRALVHLEALELIGEQADIRLNAHNGVCGVDVECIWEYLQWDDSNNRSASIDQWIRDCWSGEHRMPQQLVNDLSPMASSSIVLSDTAVDKWADMICVLEQLKCVYSCDRLLSNLIGIWIGLNQVEDGLSADQIFFKSIESLAESTSSHLEYLHKFSECILVRNLADNMDFVRLAKQLSCYFYLASQLQLLLSHEFIKKIKHTSKPTDSGHLATNLLLECGNAEDYFKNAARLIIPAIQLAFVNANRIS